MTVAQPKAVLRILPADRVRKARSAWMMAMALQMCSGATPGPVTLGLSAGIRTSKRRAPWRLPTSWKRTSLATAGCEQVVAFGASISGTYKATPRSLTAPLATLRSARDGAHRRLLFGRRSLGIILNQRSQERNYRANNQTRPRNTAVNT